MKLGVQRFIEETALHQSIVNKKIAFLGHAASVNHSGQHSLDALHGINNLQVTCAFGPQHGMLTKEQDNMIESDHYLDPKFGIPVYSLYSEIREPSLEMMDEFEVLIVDIQDIGARTYSYITTLFTMVRFCSIHSKKIVILDRPNPSGRTVEGSFLQEGYESFIGAEILPMRYGLTLGELARWFIYFYKLDIEIEFIDMDGYQPNREPGFGWPVFELPWVNPSPNASSLNMVRCFPGTCLLEGTTLSEGRGTTNSLEMFGAPDLDFERVLKEANQIAPEWLKGCILRVCKFEPGFDKYQNITCSGLQIHTDFKKYKPDLFHPYRLVAIILKTIRKFDNDYELWRKGPFEYVEDKWPIDLLSGGPFLREWVEDRNASIEDLEQYLLFDEQQWQEERKPFMIYS